ncbi:MAG: hypothetical protein HY219_01200 [Candidatus Staskawiczbacteria bacterium]|nr:hypothetical protein [Candidatus Staskawiczbacteria bacterium]
MESAENDKKKQEEFVNSYISFLEEQNSTKSLDETQKNFLRLIKERGVCVHMTEEAKKSKEFQELTNLLAEMHKRGSIPNFQVVEV